MVLVVALADDQYDVGYTEGAAVHHHLAAGSNQLAYLMCRQTIGINTEGQTIDGQIHHGMILAGQLMLHLTDGLIGEQPLRGGLITPALVAGINDCPEGCHA